MTSRSCGTCSVCCSRPSIEEIGKPENVLCDRHDGRRCSKYEQRPTACREFACLWLQGNLPKEHRPDRLGVAFSATRAHAPDMDVIEAWEIRPDAAREGDGFKVLKALAERFPVLVHYAGGESRVMGPAEGVRRLQATLLRRKAPGAEGAP